MSDYSLEGKTALVVGATYGIGAETVRYMAGLGANVVVTGRSTDKGEAVVEAIRADGGTASFVRVDVGVEGEVRAMVGRGVESYGRLDAIVNNAIASDVAASSGENRLAELTNALHAIPVVIAAGPGLRNLANVGEFWGKDVLRSGS